MISLLLSNTYNRKQMPILRNPQNDEVFGKTREGGQTAGRATQRRKSQLKSNIAKVGGVRIAISKADSEKQEYRICKVWRSTTTFGLSHCEEKNPKGGVLP